MIGSSAWFFEMSVVVITDATAMESNCWLTMVRAVLDLGRNDAVTMPILRSFEAGSLTGARTQS